MERPFMNMSEPHEQDYLKRIRNIALYKYYEHFRNEDEDEDDEEEEGYHRTYFPTNDGPLDGNSHWNSLYRDQPETPKDKIKDINLQFLLDLLPAGVSPADVKIGSCIDSGSMGIYGHEITFYYTKELPAEPEKFKEDHAKWAELYAEYEVKYAAYQEWEAQKEIENKQVEIRKLSEQLRKLKK